jgi:hypothetical protein
MLERQEIFFLQITLTSKRIKPVEFRGRTIIPSIELHGKPFGFVNEDSIYVSHAVYELLQDPQVCRIVMDQVNLIYLDADLDEIDRTIEYLFSRN